MQKLGDEGVETLYAFVGDMGIKKICVGNDTLYERPGGYLYLELNTEEE